MSALALLAPLFLAASPARVTVLPEHPKPGDPVLVRVKGGAGGGEKAPSGKLGGEALRFLPVRGGWEALAAIPETAVGEIAVRVDGASRFERTYPLAAREVRKVEVDVEEIFVDPPAEHRARIDADRDAVERAYQQPFVPWTSSQRFVWPRPEKVTGGFGDERLFNGEKTSWHYGVDLAGAKGAPVKAANAGHVVLVRDCFFSGTTVIVHHGGDLYTAYFHLSRATVKPGEDVKRGARLGHVGATGRATAPHLHFAVHAAGKYVDPETFMHLPFPSPPRRITSGRSSS